MNSLSVFDHFLGLVLKGLKFILDQALKQWLTVRKRGEDGNVKFDYLENEKNFLDKIKNILHSF